MQSKAIEQLEKIANTCRKWLETNKKLIEETKKAEASDQNLTIIKQARNIKIFCEALRAFLLLHRLAEAQLKADPSVSTYGDLDRAYSEGRLYEELISHTRTVLKSEIGQSVPDEQFIELISVVGKMIAFKTLTLTSISERRLAEK